MKQTILIRNVQVVQGDVMPRCDMLIQDGVIAKFGRDLPDAAGLIPEPPALSALIHTGGSYAVLHQLQDPGNAGMILRTADALGLDGVIYSASCDIYSPKVVRATMGSLFRVPLCCVPEIEPVLAACRDAGVESCAAVVSGQAELVGQCLFRKGTAVVIGNEGNGLPEEVSAACDRRVTIPMHGTIESLNAAMAAGIILWEVQKAAAAGNGGQ